MRSKIPRNARFRFQGKRLLPLAALCGVALSLTSCGPKLTADHLAKIETGMSADQVEDILGKPDDVQTGQALGFTGEALTYHTKPSDVKIVLVNDKVISVTGEIKSN